MDSFEQPRRSFVLALGGLGVSPFLRPALVAGQAGAGAGFVLGPSQGEQLIHFRDGGAITITLGAATGSSDLAVGTQQVMRGTGIPIHRHFTMDEAFYVLDGELLVRGGSGGRSGGREVSVSDRELSDAALRNEVEKLGPAWQ